MLLGALLVEPSIDNVSLDGATCGAVLRAMDRWLLRALECRDNAGLIAVEVPCKTSPIHFPGLTPGHGVLEPSTGSVSFAGAVSRAVLG